MDCIEGSDLKSEVGSLLTEAVKSQTMNIQKLKDIYSKYQSVYAAETKSIMDMVFKEQALYLAFDERSVADTKFLLNAAVQCVKEQLCGEGLPCMMFADMIDCQTLDYCQQLFSFLEENVSTFKSTTFFTPCRNHILRTCNDLQKRLSKSTNSQFCGRILMFLASFFPPSDRSGINLPGNFHLENVTSYDRTGTDYFAQQSTEDTEMVDLEEGESVEVKTKPVDYIFYCKFWSMQDFFREPNQCYSQSGWLQLMNNTNDMLSVFKSLKLEDSSKQRKKDIAKTVENPDTAAVATVSRENSVTSAGFSKDLIDTAYFAKYLTNQKLLELQLDDNKFRRSILVQFLILLQYLTTSTIFKKSEFILKPEQAKWVEETTTTIYELLEQVPPNGEQFVNYVRSVLKREEYWSEWKNNRCKDPEGEKPGKGNRRPQRRRKSVAEEMLARHSSGKIVFGQNKELERLWNKWPDHMAACQEVSVQTTPNLLDFFRTAIEQLDPSSQVEPQYQLIGDSNFQWKALRLLAAKSPNFFQPSSQQPKPITGYLETMLKMMGEEWRESGVLPKVENVIMASSSHDNKPTTDGVKKSDGDTAVKDEVGVEKCTSLASGSAIVARPSDGDEPVSKKVKVVDEDLCADTGGTGQSEVVPPRDTVVRPAGDEDKLGGATEDKEPGEVS